MSKTTKFYRLVAVVLAAVVMFGCAVTPVAAATTVTIATTTTSSYVETSSTFYSYTYSYNKVAERTITYDDGKVTLEVDGNTFTLCNTGFAANGHVFCDKYGTVWVVSRGGYLFWANYELQKRTITLIRWNGVAGNMNILSEGLKCYFSSVQYVATHYVNQFLVEVELPSIIELYIYMYGEEPNTGDEPTTEAPTTVAPTTEAPTTQAPTTVAPTTQAPTTVAPTTEAPTTQAPTTEAPTTQAPTTVAPTTQVPATEVPTTEEPKCDAPNNNGNANAPDSNANGGNNNNAVVDNTNNGDGNTNQNEIGQEIVINNTVTNVTVNGNGNTLATSVATVAASTPEVPVVEANTDKTVAKSSSSTTKKTTTTVTKAKVKKKTYWQAIQSGYKLKLYKVTQKVTKKGKIKTTRQWKSICLFDKKKERMDWNAYKITKVKKCQYSNKKHWIVIITTSGVVKACPSGKGTKYIKTLGSNAITFKCNERGLAYAYVTKNGTVVKLKY